MTIARKHFGAAGELQAKRFLEQAGLEFIGANVANRYGELDLLMRDDKILVGVEVKTRRSVGQGHPAEAVTPAKLRHLANALQYFVRQQGYHGPWRIDVVAISGPTVSHLRNVTG